MQETVEVLLEIPYHLDSYATQAITGIAWSPNSEQIGFVLTSREQGWSSVRAMDIQTKQIVDLGEGFAPFAWAPDSAQIAVTARTSENQWAVDLVESNGNVLRIFDANQYRIIGVDWSPDGTQLAITHLAQGQEQSTLQIVNILTGETKPIKLASEYGSNYSMARWSPDGRFLAIRLADLEEATGLAIFALEEGSAQQIFISELSIDQWSWSDDTAAIMLLVGGDLVTVTPFPPPKIGIYYWQENIFELISFPTPIQEQIDNWQIILGQPVW